MKMSFLKKFTLSLGLATLFISSMHAALIHHHHSDKTCSTIPFPDASVYVGPAVVAWHGIIGDLNTIFAAGSYSGSFQSVPVSNLITAATGTSSGSTGQAIAAFQNVLLNLNANTTLVTNIGSQMRTLNSAAINYATSVYIQSSSQQAALFSTWLNEGKVLSQLLAQLSSNQDEEVINNFMSEMIYAQGQVILGYVGVVGDVSPGVSQAQVAIAKNLVAHVDATNIAGYVVGQLIISDNCNSCCK